MCEFCIKHGEGEKWYLQAKNYSNDLLSDIKRHGFVKDFYYWVRFAYNYKYPLLTILPYKTPVIGNISKWAVGRIFKNTHWGQVVPLEDVEKIFNITNCITRVPCACRIASTGKEHRMCFLICLDPKKIGMADIMDQSFFKGPDVSRFERVDKKWALNFVKETEVKGMVHTIWTFKSPFIGGLCSCDLATGCVPMKMYKYATPITFKAEYVAVVDTNKCVGCRQCLKLCQFDAIVYDNKNKKIKIDVKKCYGCGICRSVCKANAIALYDRQSITEAAKLW